MDAATELAHIRQENEKLRAENADLGRRLELLGVNCEDLKRQLEWFHRQLFGSKSEKRIEIPPEQMTFWDQLGLEDPKEPEEPEFETVKRRKRGKKRFEGAVNESGLRFGPDVPVETIPIDNPEAAAIPESERELVGEKVVHKLAQITCDYRILRYVTRSWKRRDTGEFIAAAPPPAVLDRTCADVSFLAGMMVDKFCWHLPLHRQHQRLEAAGIQVSRSSLTNWMLRSASLLAPVCDAQFRSILESKVIAMDETPIRAGRTGPGKMRTAWFWPVFGDRDEIAFPFRLSRGERRRPRPARRLQGDAGLGRQPGLRRLRGIPKRRGHARFLLGARPAPVREGEGFRAEARRRGAGADRRALRLRGKDSGKEAEGPRKARVPTKPGASGGERLLEVVPSPLRGSAPPAEEPDREGAELRPEPAEPAGGVAVRPRGADRHQPPRARTAGPAARTEELAVLLDGGRSGSRRNRPEPDRDLQAAGRRSASLPGGRAPAGLGPSVEARRRSHAEAVEGSIRRRSDGLGPRDRSPMPRLRSDGRWLNPAKYGKRATSQFARLPSLDPRPEPAAAVRCAQRRRMRADLRGPLMPSIDSRALLQIWSEVEKVRIFPFSCCQTVFEHGHRLGQGALAQSKGAFNHADFTFDITGQVEAAGLTFAQGMHHFEAFDRGVS